MNRQEQKKIEMVTKPWKRLAIRECKLNNETSLHTYQHGWDKKNDDTKAGEDMEELDHSHIAGKNVKYYCLSGKQVGSFL